MVLQRSKHSSPSCAPRWVNRQHTHETRHPIGALCRYTQQKDMTLAETRAASWLRLLSSRHEAGRQHRYRSQPGGVDQNPSGEGRDRPLVFLLRRPHQHTNGEGLVLRPATHGQVLALLSQHSLLDQKLGLQPQDEPVGLLGLLDLLAQAGDQLALCTTAEQTNTLSARGIGQPRDSREARGERTAAGRQGGYLMGRDLLLF